MMPAFGLPSSSDGHSRGSQACLRTHALCQALSPQWVMPAHTIYVGSLTAAMMPVHALCWSLLMAVRHACTCSVGPSYNRHLSPAFRLSLCPGLQCLGLCSCGSLSHVCEFEARPAAPSVGKSVVFAAGSASLTAAAIATTMT